ncbi:hypothetical protein V474_19405 [Novosphingobium barchaimii LL02]|uniref:DUF4268 domain-containing protein n=1 Tax=Novosphingobium barchaimii LL02 TaxID=1114963 RepID=A0A0J7XU72_9SPHN|nr:DUF4268 domain-containing protein [Novosphingobium barchaimii]KMS55209.1 hypothetical protein V474_19405 [Novosphingobium barchaimii LL02]
MPVYELVEGKLTAANQTFFQAEGLKERQDIQRMLREQIGILGDDLMVLAEEYGGWVDSYRRIDLLCLDADANLVVVELKRDDAAHMELQALRYAAMVARMTFAEAVDAHADFRRRNGMDDDGAEAALLDFLRWTEPQEEAFAQSVRVILASADFGKELTTAVLWLRDQGIDITCIRLGPCKLSDGRLLLDVQQIIPLPEAATFQTQIGLKRRAERKDQGERHSLRQLFWTGLLALPAATRYAGKAVPTGGWIASKTEFEGVELNLVIRKTDCQAELYIDCGRGAEDRNIALFEHLQKNRDQINIGFGGKLLWQPLEGRRACRIATLCDGGWKSPEQQWGKAQQDMLDSAHRLLAAAHPYLQTWNG